MEKKELIPEEKTPNVESNNQNLAPVKKNNGLVITLIIIIILMAGGIIYLLFFHNNEGKDNKDDPKPRETPSSVVDATDEEGDNVLYVYASEHGGEVFSSYKEGTEKVSIKVKNANAKLICNDSQYSGKFILYDDNGLYIYNLETKKSEKVNLENNYKEYQIYLSENGDKIIGVGYIDNNKYGYYNISRKMKLYTTKYSIDEMWQARQINDHYIALRSDKMIYLLSTDEESIKLSFKDENEVYTYVSFGENNQYVFALALSIDDYDYKRFYNNKFQLFYETSDNDFLGENNVNYYNNYFYIFDGVLNKYSLDGNKVSASTDYGKIQLFYKDYIVYVKDDSLILGKLDNSISKTITKWNNNWSISSYDSGYYTQEALNMLEENNKKEGLYIVVEYLNKDKNGNYGMEYCYTPDKQIVEYPIKSEKGGRAKPVLYLYPTEETNVTVTFAHPEFLTTTYPKYLKSWEVTAKPNGDLRDKDGKYYYALYWDEKRYSETDFTEGFYVEGKNAIKFLEEKLTIIGLNEKERNEFIMYWLPIMEKNGKNLVYFELTEEREINNKLIINPTPDSLLRVSIHIKKVNSKVSIKEQKLTTFNRYGFTAVEWGGMTY